MTVMHLSWHAFMVAVYMTAGLDLQIHIIWDFVNFTSGVVGRTNWGNIGNVMSELQK